mmetsp:Transcript_3386/g.4030  ORF Transcript_3386/g.4030 Transcript_3386/m.4030 type:complete len:132 (-) Transcript_3386:351-746(-)
MVLSKADISPEFRARPSKETWILEASNPLCSKNFAAVWKAMEMLQCPNGSVSEPIVANTLSYGKTESVGISLHSNISREKKTVSKKTTVITVNRNLFFHLSSIASFPRYIKKGTEHKHKQTTIKKNQPTTP